MRRAWLLAALLLQTGCACATTKKSAPRMKPRAVVILPQDVTPEGMVLKSTDGKKWLIFVTPEGRLQIAQVKE